jgi:hypothetical protein
VPGTSRMTFMVPIFFSLRQKAFHWAKRFAMNDTRPQVLQCK